MHAYIRLLSSRVSPEYRLTWFLIQFQTLFTQKLHQRREEKTKGQILLFTTLLSQHLGIQRLGFTTNKCKFQMPVFVTFSPKAQGSIDGWEEMGGTIRVETEDTTSYTRTDKLIKQQFGYVDFSITLPFMAGAEPCSRPVNTVCGDVPNDVA